MPKILKLTGIDSLLSPYTYNTKLLRDKVAKFSDVDSAALLLMTSKHPTTGASVATFTEMASNTPFDFDLSARVSPWKLGVDNSVTIHPSKVAGIVPKIPSGVLLRGSDNMPYGYSNGNGGVQGIPYSVPNAGIDPRKRKLLSAYLILSSMTKEPFAAPGDSGAIYTFNTNATNATVTLHNQGRDEILQSATAAVRPRCIPFAAPMGAFITTDSGVNAVVVFQGN